ncbi:MAG: UvrD-helicase domain-containing protein, partial [Candidatus Sumerlaeia bacterium]|nr:UvrD-helicase domain-containing protein [Candidatus Sumerlaeia bacterium]
MALPIRSWTPQQQAVIQAAPQTVLVNAGAGTGKTASLIERLLNLLDRDPSVPDPQEHPTSLQRVVLVTFTNAAAREMRERLSKGLRQRLELCSQEGRETTRQLHLRSEIAQLPRASISTLHSFCITLLRQYGHLLGLAPDFEILSEEEAHLLRTEMLAEALEHWANDEKSRRLLLGLLPGSQPESAVKRLTTEILQLHSFLEAHAQPGEFVASALNPFKQADSEDCSPSTWELWAQVVEYLREPMGEYLTALKPLQVSVPRSELTGTFLTYVEHADAIIGTVEEFLSESAQEPFIPAKEDLAPIRKPGSNSIKNESQKVVWDLATEAKSAFDVFSKILPRTSLSWREFQKEAQRQLP